MKASDFRPDSKCALWHAELPRELGTFYGKTITVTTDRLMPEELEQPSAHDMGLLAKILEALPHILARAKSEFEQYELDPLFADHIVDPQISISHGEVGREDEWALIIHRSDHPDYGCHIEFKETEFKEIWGGD